MAVRRASKEDLSVEEMGDYQGRMAEMPDGYTANFEAIPAGMGGPER